VYEYLARGTRSSVGVLGAGAYVVGLLFLGAGGGFVAEGYLLDNLLAGELSVHLGWAAWALLSLAAAVGVNWVGVRIGVRAIVVTTGLSVVPFLVIAVAVIAGGGVAGNTIAVLDPGQTSVSDVFHGILFAVALFIGFETVAALGEEATAPRRTIPRAMIVSIVVCAVFFTLTTYAGAIGFGRGALEDNAWYASGNPFGELGQRYVGHALGWIVNLTIVLDLFSVCVAFTLAASRVLMALARDGLLPSALGRTSRRYRTPTGGLTTITAWSLVVIGWAAISRLGDAAHIPNVLEAVLILSATGSYLITLVYVLLAIGGLWLAWTDRGRRPIWWTIPVVLIAIAVPVLSFDGSLHPFPAYPNDIAVYVAAGVVALTLVWYVALRIWRSAAIATIAPDAAPLLAAADETGGVAR
jgi:amino acid transporter